MHLHQLFKVRHVLSLHYIDANINSLGRFVCLEKDFRVFCFPEVQHRDPTCGFGWLIVTISICTCADKKVIFFKYNTGLTFPDVSSRMAPSELEFSTIQSSSRRQRSTKGQDLRKNVYATNYQSPWSRWIYTNHHIFTQPAGGQPHTALLGFTLPGIVGKDHQALAFKTQPQAWLHTG